MDGRPKQLNKVPFFINVSGIVCMGSKKLKGKGSTVPSHEQIKINSINLI